MRNDSDNGVDLPAFLSQEASGLLRLINERRSVTVEQCHAELTRHYLGTLETQFLHLAGKHQPLTQHLATMLLKTPPFCGIEASQLYNIRNLRTCPCPGRDGLIKTLTIDLYSFCAAWLAMETMVRGFHLEVVDSLAQLRGAVAVFYPLSKKLPGHLDALEHALCRRDREAYANVNQFRRRRLDHSKKMLSARMCWAFRIDRPSRKEYPDEAVHWAIALIVTYFSIEDGALADIAERIRKRCLRVPIRAPE